jgi:hypothetical protein
LSGAAAAGDLPAPTGEVVLTVKGRIAVTNAEDGAVLDIAALEAMGPVTVETSTIWTDGVQTFRGVPLATLLDFLGAEGEELIAHALNDYSVSIPLEDAVPDGPIVAFEQNGRRLSVRDKGPLWIVYPYDRQTDYQSEVIYARSIWQLAWIEVK